MMTEFVSECVKTRIFFPVNREFDETRKYVESTFANLRSEINPFLANDVSKNLKNCCYQLSFQPFILARLYGTFKLHKIGKVEIPVRPIVSTVDGMGKHLCNWLLKKLELITAKISKFTIKNSVEFFSKVSKIKLDDEFILATMDYDSMFTNVSFGKTKLIIRKYYHFVAEETSVPVETFLKALSFFIEVDAYFLFNGNVYRQCKGLSMGNKLSKILAEIFVSENLNKTMDEFSKDLIAFLSIFVDDIGCSVHRNHIEEFKRSIVKNSEMNVKLDVENTDNTITYMNMAIRRFPDENNILRAYWWQKP